MKKILILILVLIILLSAFLIPKAFDNGVNNFSGEEREKVEQLVSDIKVIHFNGLQKAMMLNYNVENVSWNTKHRCYEATVSFYTIFNINYSKAKANCEEIVSVN